MIVYKRQSLFDAPEGAYLVHACNTAGVWGSGIATEFKKRFPHAFAVYERSCQGNSRFALGQFWAIYDNKYNVTCLLVSMGYGRSLDAKESILENTKIALDRLVKYALDNKIKQIHSNKFNSGFFRVPWPETEAILVECLKDSDIEWVICDPELTVGEQ
jgi:ADP-ribose 1''-phosphate phosphatase